MKKSTLINVIIIVIVIIIALVILLNKPTTTNIDEKTAICIGSNSILYVQLGCSHCKVQEDMFGDFKTKLNIIDCFYEKEKCTNITGTPTWVIKGQNYIGVQSIETLQNLTECK
jgi:hypothetical protein